MTWIESLPDGSELPLLSALNDRSNTGEGRLRQVWVFTFTPPSLGQRVASAVPFLYHRVWSEKTSGAKRPQPLMDLGDPTHGLWPTLGASLLQAEVVNPAGAIARLTTRSYGGNLSEYRKTHVWEALDTVSDAFDASQSSAQAEILASRLELNGAMFSGLARDSALPSFFEKYTVERTETRGHNWELLRQAAEDNGLYFEPLRIGATMNAYAMIWADPADLKCSGHKASTHFDGRFLKFTDPFDDASLCHWKGYTRDGRIPLALYSLDYPRVPLLLVDFRRATAPTRKEMTERAADDVTIGVLGLTGFGASHLGYEALKSSWLFVDKRHGGTTNRALRRRAFVDLRHAIGTDDSLEPSLRGTLANRLSMLDIDPDDRSWDQEVKSAQEQYAALLQYLTNPKGVPTMLAKDQKEDRPSPVISAGAGE